jgi:hypothetical protein
MMLIAPCLQRACSYLSCCFPTSLHVACSDHVTRQTFKLLMTWGSNLCKGAVMLDPAFAHGVDYMFPPCVAVVVSPDVSRGQAAGAQQRQDVVHSLCKQQKAEATYGRVQGPSSDAASGPWLHYFCQCSS